MPNLDQNDDWDNMIDRILRYVDKLTYGDLQQLDTDLGIKEFQTVFGLLRVRLPRLFKENK